MHPPASCSFIVSVLLLSLTACGDIPAAPDDGATTEASGIVGGSSTDDYPAAVLVDMELGGEVVAGCTGTLIAPRVVLTAGHCVHGFDAWQVTAPALLAHRRSARAAVYDWDVDGEHIAGDRHDVGLIFLRKPVMLASYPPLADGPLESEQRVRNIGRVRDGEVTERLFVSAPLAVELGASVGHPFAYVAEPRIERGDSGGPAIVADDARHTVAAVNSGVGEVEVLARVDLLRDWISGQATAHTDPATCPHDPCVTGGSLTTACAPCVAAVCEVDDYCCTIGWDEQCLGHTVSACNCG
jgi:hypothetical protein